MPPAYIFPRLLFPKGEQKAFIEKVFEKDGLNAVMLSEIIGVSPRTIRDWKREKYNISEAAVRSFCKSFNIFLPNNINQLRNNWLMARREVCRKKAVAQYKKVGNFSTPEGCKKGGSKTLKMLRELGIIPGRKNYTLPKNKTESLAEFVGILLGDGGITKWQTTVTLNSEADKQYIEFVSSLGKNLFGSKPTLIKKKDCQATDLSFSGINLVDYFVSIGLKRGNKVLQQVSVPGWIQASNYYSTACLRGLMDTDGCVVKVTHKYKSKKYVYYNPCFANRSKPLLKFVADTMKDLGLHPSVTGERIWLYNKAEVQAYFELVGSKNQRLNRYKPGG